MFRLRVAVALVILASGIKAAANDPDQPALQPTHLDYLILASMAYAARPLAMALYRPTDPAQK